MQWYLVHTKPKQEKCALENLERQGYQCYLPTLPTEKLQQGLLKVLDEPLFPRYLFIRLGQDDSSQSWAPIRSTKGVNRLVSFGSHPARVDVRVVEQLQAQEAALQGHTVRLLMPGDRVQLAEGPFAGIEGVYQMAEGERRAMVLIELLSRPVALHVEPAGMRKVG